MLVEIEDKVISTEIFEKHFVCDLNKCKGHCCIEGDSGAPLTEGDIHEIESNINDIMSFMSIESQQRIKAKGFYMKDEDNEKVTSLMSNGACVFAVKNKQGIYSCSIENAFHDKKINYKKPLSCHLYPIRLKAFNSFIGVNYNKWDICNSACSLGDNLKVKVYQFLKDPIERAFGKSFYNELQKIDAELNKIKKDL